MTHIDEMQALVIVEHEGGFYNLYLSDESGVYFSLSLRDIVVEDFYTLRIDLELVRDELYVCVLTMGSSLSRSYFHHWMHCLVLH